MSEKTATFQITIRSPLGSQSIESFRHWLGKVADDAQERWNISISIERVEAEVEESTEFN